VSSGKFELFHLFGFRHNTDGLGLGIVVTEPENFAEALRACGNTITNAELPVLPVGIALSSCSENGCGRLYSALQTSGSIARKTIASCDVLAKIAEPARIIAAEAFPNTLLGIIAAGTERDVIQAGFVAILAEMLDIASRARSVAAWAVITDAGLARAGFVTILAEILVIAFHARCTAAWSIITDAELTRAGMS